MDTADPAPAAPDWCVADPSGSRSDRTGNRCVFSRGYECQCRIGACPTRSSYAAAKAAGVELEPPGVSAAGGFSYIPNHDPDHGTEHRNETLAAAISFSDHRWYQHLSLIHI